jgi:hypothetical protein
VLSSSVPSLALPISYTSLSSTRRLHIPVSKTMGPSHNECIYCSIGQTNEHG